ncbi:MAG: type II toxin-antitoxin system HicB family antitoxin [Cyanobacteria bacterium J06560_2]
MNNQVEYKGYLGEVSVDMEAGLLHGRVVNIERDVLTFRGETPTEAKQDFYDMIDEYLSDCEADGTVAEKPKEMATTQ